MTATSEATPALQEMVERCGILRAVVGSTAHGLAVDDSLEDRDEMVVVIEDISQAIGLQYEFHTTFYRTARARHAAAVAAGTAQALPRGWEPRSEKGDLDLTAHSLRKYLRLCLKGNPSVLILLFADPAHIVSRTELGRQLQGLAPYIVSRQAASAFLGYMEQQRGRFLGVRGQKDVNRPELVQQFGFDTKYAMHMLRLGYQGIELLETGRMTLPMPIVTREFLLGVRTGKVTFSECDDIAKGLENRLAALKTTSMLPEQPDVKRVEQWMLDAYYSSWTWRNAT